MAKQPPVNNTEQGKNQLVGVNDSLRKAMDADASTGGKKPKLSDKKPDKSNKSILDALTQVLKTLTDAVKRI
jgi:hypothetical protein